MKFSLWMEGAACNGSKSKALFLGEYDAETFNDAVISYFGTLSDVDKYYISTSKLTYWGCRIFDNEEDARKSFG